MRFIINKHTGTDIQSYLHVITSFCLRIYRVTESISGSPTEARESNLLRDNRKGPLFISILPRYLQLFVDQTSMFASYTNFSDPNYNLLSFFGFVRANLTCFFPQNVSQLPLWLKIGINSMLSFIYHLLSSIDV